MPENKSEQLALSLPYEELKGIQGTTFVRDNYNGSSLRAYKIPFKDILIRDNYNARKTYNDIPELAESILHEGQKTAFDLVVTKDGAYLKRGHRRHKAYLLLIEQGKFKPTNEVLFFPVSNEETELDMTVDLYTSNNLSEKLHFLEQAEVARRIKFCFGKEKTNEEVAALMKVSRQTVDNLIKIATSPDDVKNQIFMAGMNFTEAIAFINGKKKAQKEADKVEEASHQTSAAIIAPPEDPLKKDMEELAALEENAEEYKKREENRRRQELEQLQEIADEVIIGKDSLLEKMGKKLAADAVSTWEQDFVDEGTGNVITIERNKVIAKKGVEIDQELISDLIDENVKSVYIYKQNPVAESVFTELPAQEEKSKFDLDRPEVAQIINCIKLADRIEARIEKIECIDEGTKKDISDWVKWMQNDLAECREYIHKNKRQNKIR